MKELYLVVNTINGLSETYTDYEKAREMAEGLAKYMKGEVVPYIITLKVDEKHVIRDMSACLY